MQGKGRQGKQEQGSRGGSSLTRSNLAAPRSSHTAQQEAERQALTIRKVTQTWWPFRGVTRRSRPRQGIDTMPTPKAAQVAEMEPSERRKAKVRTLQDLKGLHRTCDPRPPCCTLKARWPWASRRRERAVSLSVLRAGRRSAHRARTLRLSLARYYRPGHGPRVRGRRGVFSDET